MRTLALALALLAGPALAVDTGGGGASLAPARAAIDAGNWSAALSLLQPIVAAEPRNADALNLSAYANRHLGNLDDAARLYEAALAVDPSHLGALEYQGELFVMQGDRAGAEANLQTLVRLCGSCEEQEDLAKALAGS